MSGRRSVSYTNCSSGVYVMVLVFSNIGFDICDSFPCLFIENYPDCTQYDDDRDYNGTMSTTVSGLSCQPWDSQSPHTHSYEPSDVLVGNYCRNPPTYSRQTWCYTMDKGTEWDYCPKITSCQTGISNYPDSPTFPGYLL